VVQVISKKLDDLNFEKDEPLIYKTIKTTLEMMVAIEQFHPAGSERNTEGLSTHKILFLLLGLIRFP